MKNDVNTLENPVILEESASFLTSLRLDWGYFGLLEYICHYKKVKKIALFKTMILAAARELYNDKSQKSGNDIRAFNYLKFISEKEEEKETMNS